MRDDPKRLAAFKKTETDSGDRSSRRPEHRAV